MSTSKSYDKFLERELKDPELAALYLKASFDDALKDGEWRVFLIAIQHVVNAHKLKKQTIAKDSGISRQYLHQILSGKGNPTIEVLAKVLKTINISINFSANPNKD